MYVYKVSNAGVSEAFVIEVSIAAAFDLTALLCVVIADGIAVSSSVFLTTYQSVFANSLAAFSLTILIKLYFNPLDFNSPSVPKPSISSCAVKLASACAFAVASPYDPLTLPPLNA